MNEFHSRIVIKDVSELTDKDHKLSRKVLKNIFNSSDEEIISIFEHHLLIKFTKIKYIEQLQKGTIHFCRLSYYRSAESEENAIFDSMEGVDHASNCIVDMIDEQTNKPILTNVKTDHFNVSYNQTDSYGICCFSRPVLKILHRNNDCIVFEVDATYVAHLMSCFDCDAAYLFLSHTIEKAFKNTSEPVECRDLVYTEDTICVHRDLGPELSVALIDCFW